jgi:WD repeat-containing protein 35
MLTEIGFQETFQYVQQNPHPRLWRLLGEATLQSLDLESANKCFVNCSDYYSIQFIKRIQYIDDREKLRAEVAAYFGRFDESDQIYTSIDRRDLSLDLRLRLSDWLSVQQIMDQDKSLAIDDRLVERVKQSLGDLYFDRKKYAQALPHYEQGRCYDRMSDCYYQMEEFESLQRLADSLPDGHGCLPKIARQFSSVGMAAASVKTFIKVGDIKSAVEACIQLNQWDEAFKIAETYDLTDITTLLAQYAQHLLDNKKYASAIELYRKVNYCDKSAKHLFDWAEEAATQGKPLLQIKKLFVLAAMELDQYNQQRSKVCNYMYVFKIQLPIQLIASNFRNRGDIGGGTDCAKNQQQIRG